MTSLNSSLVLSLCLTLWRILPPPPLLSQYPILLTSWNSLTLSSFVLLDVILSSCFLWHVYITSCSWDRLWYPYWLLRPILPFSPIKLAFGNLLDIHKVILSHISFPEQCLWLWNISNMDDSSFWISLFIVQTHVGIWGFSGHAWSVVGH